ncbi:D-arabinono-1,4-lactone oxidase [Schaereria dolodes]|nr:D-arabinono-1,4-lactone oxidase [Schaereria dolodes]
MDPAIRRELSRVDPTVPFRASTSHQHRTWARTFYSYPELYIQPQSTEEIQKIITLARKCRRRIVTVGCGHSPSDLTCTSSWQVNLDKYNQVLSIDDDKRIVVMQAGIRLKDLGLEMKEHRLTMPNLGSIDNQSIAGAIGTATHGSSTRHGILSQSVLGLKIMLSNGRTVSCSAEHNKDLFRAALVSLGALGIVIEVTFQAVPSFNIQWNQSLHPLQEILEDWSNDLWTEKEFTRVWWMPYMKQAVKWRAEKTDKPTRAPKPTLWKGILGYHAYHIVLYVAQWIPRILPLVEKFVITVQYGNADGTGSSAVEEARTGLLMNCLYSQFVNEWAIPLAKGPEAINRLSAWLNHDQMASRIPFDSTGIYVHAPIEVRVTDTSSTTPRPYLDNTVPGAPTLYLNATLYRPYNKDPPCTARYYEAFEWLMKEMGGRPHWAKNFSTVTKEEIHCMYPEMNNWLRIRNEVDPEGMFVGDWHRRYLLLEENGSRSPLPLEEREVKREKARGGGVEWSGEIPSKVASPQASEESFELMHGVEAEKSVLFSNLPEDEESRRDIFE